MSNPYGPWATLIDAGSNPQLSAFWRRRLTMLVSVSQTSPVLSRRNLFWLVLAAVMIGMMPTVRSTAIATEPKKTPVATVHVVAEMRTLPYDNYSMIGSDVDFVKVEVWRDFGTRPKWRVEKPGRILVMDGASTLNFIRPNIAYKLPFATEGAFDSGPLLQLAQDQDMLARVTQSAQSNGWDAKTTHETTSSGEKKTILTVEAKSGLPKDDYARNKFFDSADTRRVYRFDEATQRLEGVEVYLHESGRDVLILKTTRIDYDQPLASNTFSLALPEDVAWIKETQKLSDNEKYERMTPQEAAKAFFEACAKEDWAEAQKFWGGLPVDDRIKTYLGGLAIVSLGEPFQSKGYASPDKGWFVPYEIKLKDGSVKKFNLAVRKDNPANRYIVDGGI
jgi:hypothetical protein